VFKYVFEFASQVHLDLVISFARNKKFNRMSDERDTVLFECGYYARFGAAQDSPMERRMQLFL